VGIAVLLLVAEFTSGAPEPGTPIPAIAWGFAAVISLGGATRFALLSRATAPNRTDPIPRRPSSPSSPHTVARPESRAT
jgi:hypothetical protein